MAFVGTYSSVSIRGWSGDDSAGNVSYPYYDVSINGVYAVSLDYYAQNMIVSTLVRPTETVTEYQNTGGNQWQLVSNLYVDTISDFSHREIESIEISSDGTVAAFQIAGTNRDTNELFVYRKVSGNWTKIAELNPNLSIGNTVGSNAASYGLAISPDGTKIMVSGVESYSSQTTPTSISSYTTIGTGIYTVSGNTVTGPTDISQGPTLLEVINYTPSLTVGSSNTSFGNAITFSTSGATVSPSDSHIYEEGSVGAIYINGSPLYQVTYTGGGPGTGYTRYPYAACVSNTEVLFAYENYTWPSVTERGIAVTNGVGGPVQYTIPVEVTRKRYVSGTIQDGYMEISDNGSTVIVYNEIPADTVNPPTSAEVVVLKKNTSGKWYASATIPARLQSISGSFGTVNVSDLHTVSLSGDGNTLAVIQPTNSVRFYDVR